MNDTWFHLHSCYLCINWHNKATKCACCSHPLIWSTLIHVNTTNHTIKNIVSSWVLPCTCLAPWCNIGLDCIWKLCVSKTYPWTPPHPYVMSNSFMLVHHCGVVVRVLLANIILSICWLKALKKCPIPLGVVHWLRPPVCVGTTSIYILQWPFSNAIPYMPTFVMQVEMYLLPKSIQLLLELASINHPHNNSLMYMFLIPTLEHSWHPLHQITMKYLLFFVLQKCIVEKHYLPTEN